MTVAPSPSGFHGHRYLTWPATRLGRWSALCAAGVAVWWAVLSATAFLDVADRGWAARAAVIAFGLAGIAAALSAAVAAVVAVVKGERSLVLAVPLLFGAFWLLFLLGEFLVPH